MLNRVWQKYRFLVALVLIVILILDHVTPVVAGFPGISIPIPTIPGVPGLGGIKDQADQAVYDQIGKALGAKAAIYLDQQAQSFPKVEPIQDFKPKKLKIISTADLLKPLLPGDYELDLLSFCTRWSIHVPGYGSPYKLARADGSRIGIITTFLFKGQLAGLNVDQLHTIDFAIQSGAPLSQWSDEDRAIVHKVIPEFEGQLEGDTLDEMKGEYERVRHTIPVNLPDFDSILEKLPLGKEVISLKTARSVITNRAVASSETIDKLYEATAQNDGLPQVLPKYSGAERSPWSEIKPGVYGRYIVKGARAGAGSDGINLLQLRISANNSGAKSLKKGGYEVAQIQLLIPLASIIYGTATAVTEEEFIAVLTNGLLRPLISYSIDSARQALVSIAAMNGDGTGGNNQNQKPVLNKMQEEGKGKIPEGWGEGKPAQGNVGWRWQDPKNKGNHVRIDPGDPKANFPSGQSDHVHVTSGGKSLDANGNPVLPTPQNPNPTKLPETHIPLGTWKNWKFWNKP